MKVTVSLNESDDTVVGNPSPASSTEPGGLSLEWFLNRLGYSRVVRIPKGATNIDIRQHNEHVKPAPGSPIFQDDNYLGEASLYSYDSFLFHPFYFITLLFELIT